MKHSKIILSLLFICTITLFSYIVIQKTSKPRILVLHSYSPEYSLVKVLNSGLESSLKGHPDVTVHWHYMDTKKNQGAAFMRRAGITARKIIKSWQPDVIIAFDDNAQRLAAKYFVNHKDINIVFAGVNAPLSLYGYNNAKNVTGMLGNIPFHGIKEVLTNIFKKRDLKLWQISDASISSSYIHNQFMKADWAPFTLIKSVQSKTFEDWKREVKAAQQAKADFLVVTLFRTIKTKDGKNMSEKKLIEWTDKNSKIPVIGVFSFLVENGGALGIGASAVEQGEWAGSTALKIIHEKIRAGKISIKRNRLFTVYIRKSAFKKRFGNIKIPLTYEAMAKNAGNYYE